MNRGVLVFIQAMNPASEKILGFCVKTFAHEWSEQFINIGAQQGVKWSENNLILYWKKNISLHEF